MRHVDADHMAGLADLLISSAAWRSHLGILPPLLVLWIRRSIPESEAFDAAL